MPTLNGLLLRLNLPSLLESALSRVTVGGLGVLLLQAVCGSRDSK